MEEQVKETAGSVERRPWLAARQDSEETPSAGTATAAKVGRRRALREVERATHSQEPHAGRDHRSEVRHQAPRCRTRDRTWYG